MEFPLMLYRPGSMLKWDGEMFDYLIVNDEGEAKAALADGWSNGRPGPKKSEADPDLQALRAEYRAAAGKAPFNGWDADTLKAKIANLAKA